jgi:uncharacterized protein (TIGR04255 family)
VFDLPDPGAYRLERPPLAIALAQVNFPLLGRLQELSSITAVQEALRPVFPYMERVQAGQVQLDVTLQGQLQSVEAAAGMAWKFTDDAGWTTVIAPGSATLAVGPTYGSIEEMATRWQLILNALAGVPGMVRCDRIGVRYVNVADVVQGSDHTWPGWFRSELMGWPTLDIFAEETALSSTITQTVLNARPIDRLAEMPYDVQGIVRNGVVPPGTVIPAATIGAPQPLQTAAILLDIDLFVVGPQPFNAQHQLSQFRLLHSQIDAFFFWSLTEEGRRHFGLVRND